MKWLRYSIAAAIVTLATVVAFSLPPAREPLAITSAVPFGARGAIHIHTRRSDGTGTIDDVAAAAARAGLKFVIITDHGDGTRQLEAPSYLHGVLVVDAVEISTDSGHVIALGAQRSPFPLGGEGRDAVQDIARLGGMAIAAHPGSPKPELRWTEWTAPFGGLEWLNGDSEWRDETRLRLLRSLLTYPLRPVETLGHLLDRPDPVLQRWDALTRRRRVVALAGSDAHARLALGSAPEPYDGTRALRIPAYERVFEAFSIVIPQLRLSREPAADARTVIEEIRRGHVFSSIDALASPAAVSFTAVSGSQRASAGDVLRIEGPVSLRVASNAPGGSQISLYQDGRPVASSTQAALEFDAQAGPAVYRAEISLNHASGDPPVPWIVTNPIYVGRSEDEPAVPSRGTPTETAAIYTDGPANGWQIESSNQSSGAFDVAAATNGGTQIRWRYALGGARADSPYVALVTAASPSIAGYDRILFTGHADKPMRASLQIRDAAGERWQRSIYLDRTPRVTTVFFDEMTPAGVTARRRPVLSTIQSLLWVIDSTHTALGASGQVWIDDVKYGRSQVLTVSSR
jgi:hypothetical protein